MTIEYQVVAKDGRVYAVPKGVWDLIDKDRKRMVEADGESAIGLVEMWRSLHQAVIHPLT